MWNSNTVSSVLSVGGGKIRGGGRRQSKFSDSWTQRKVLAAPWGGSGPRGGGRISSHRLQLLLDSPKETEGYTAAEFDLAEVLIN